jgi:hypothetical protein
MLPFRPADFYMEASMGLEPHDPLPSESELLQYLASWSSERDVPDGPTPRLSGSELPCADEEDEYFAFCMLASGMYASGSAAPSALVHEDGAVAGESAKKRRIVYQRRDPRLSMWSQLYGNEDSEYLGPKAALFRRRFRISLAQVHELVSRAESENWFPGAGRPDASGRLGVPLLLLVLGALRYLGRNGTFDCISEATNCSEEVHRVFFSKFVKACAANLYPLHVYPPRTSAELKASMSLYETAGFPGCFGSFDVTHVPVEAMSYRLRHINTGKEGSPSRGFQLVVNHKREIISSSHGFAGALNDKTVVRLDPFVLNLRNGHFFADEEWTICDIDGRESTMKGPWLMCDGGYHQWEQTLAPIKHTLRQVERDWSSALESMRKDVECTFGIMKRRFRILTFGVRVQGLEYLDDVWYTCCALHNWLLREDGLDQGWEETWTSSEATEVDEDMSQATIGRVDGAVSIGSNVTKQECDEGYVGRRQALINHYAFKKANRLVSWPARNGQQLE